MTGIPSRTAYASRSGRHTNSCALPAPELRKGPLQMGQTSKSSKRLSINPPIPANLLTPEPTNSRASSNTRAQTVSRPRNARLNGLGHDLEQRIGFCPGETRSDRHVPMLRAGHELAFYGILLGHEHRPAIGEGDIRGLQARMVRQRMAGHLDTARAQHVEKSFGIADARHRMHRMPRKLIQRLDRAPDQAQGVFRLAPHAE